MEDPLFSSIRYSYIPDEITLATVKDDRFLLVLEMSFAVENGMSG